MWSREAKAEERLKGLEGGGDDAEGATRSGWRAAGTLHRRMARLVMTGGGASAARRAANAHKINLHQ